MAESDSTKNVNYKELANIESPLGSIMDDAIAKVAGAVAREREQFAAAFLNSANLDPRQAKIVMQYQPNGVATWFEPFPDETDIELYRKRAEMAEESLRQLQGRMNALMSTLELYMTSHDDMTTAFYKEAIERLMKAEERRCHGD